MQLDFLHKRFDALQAFFGDASLKSIYGAGCVRNPKAMFVFMNPTARNVSSRKEWKGLRAPWLGTKNVWSVFNELDLLSAESFGRIQSMKPEEWTVDFARSIYQELEKNKVFVTNLAKCTQRDARPLADSVYKSYRDLMLEEIISVHPNRIIAFGNQVSSILLQKPVSVSRYAGTAGEELKIGNKRFTLYPTYYPVGQGRRNMAGAIQRVKKLLQS